MCRFWRADVRSRMTYRRESATVGFRHAPVWRKPDGEALFVAFPARERKLCGILGNSTGPKSNGPKLAKASRKTGRCRRTKWYFHDASAVKFAEDRLSKPH
jgi:hypothetical protein